MTHMTWSNTSRRSDRYGRDHQATRTQHMRALKLAGSGICAETRNPGSRCMRSSPVIYPTDDLHLCHNRRTGDVIGLGHATCNLAESARYANRRSKQRRRTITATRQSPLRW
jgi:hypothetical protein